jgi:hypothetical protein
MRSRVGLLLLVLGSGCATSQGVPNWARHVRPAGVEVDAPTDDLAARLRDELAVPTLLDGHLAPEQIALVGVREIAAGHQVDGALWLAIGSYRYHQETREAVIRGRAGFETLPINVRVNAYAELVRAEIDRYSSLGFNRELAALDARVYGRGEVEKELQEQLTALGKTTPIERESLRDALWELRPSGAAVERSRYPQLVEAFHRRLVVDFHADTHDEHPAIYLARTPIASLQVDAVQSTLSYFEPTVCASVAEAFPSLRPAIVAALESRRPQTRSNAAAVLGMAPSNETRAVLEARMAVEPDPRVKLVIASALVHHGTTGQLSELTAALQSCEGPACTLPVMLVQWLPASSKGELDQTSLSRILLGNQYEPRAHLFAAAALRDLGHQKALDPATIEALIVAARRRAHFAEEYTAIPAFDAIADAAVLSRAEVVARIKGRDRSAPTARQDVLFPGPLVARLARVSIAEDLPLLVQVMERVAAVKGPEADVVIEAALHVPGAQAEAVLTNWFSRYEGLRSHIAVGLLSRPSFPRERLERMVDRGDARSRLLVKAIEHAPDAGAALMDALDNGQIVDKLAAAELAGAVGQPGPEPSLRRALGYSDGRFYPNDALVRHAAMQSLVRIALGVAKPSPLAGAPGRH